MPSRERAHSPSSSTSTDARDGDSPALSEALARLDGAVAAIQDSDDFRAYLATQARFHRYSWGNVLLILAQRPDATHVAGYRRWRELGRQVRRGERGIKILVPMRTRAAAAADEPTPDAEGADADPALSPGRLRFGVGTIFDISQTNGRPLPRVDVPILTGDDGGELYRRLEHVAADEGLRVERSAALPRPTIMGFYAPDERRIVVRDAPTRQMTKTLAHELAHHFGGATVPGPEEETVAESVAYVACAHFGLDTGERSFPYVATWSREPHVLRAALGRIRALSASLIDRLTTDPEATSP